LISKPRISPESRQVFAESAEVGSSFAANSPSRSSSFPGIRILGSGRSVADPEISVCRKLSLRVAQWNRSPTSVQHPTPHFSQPAPLVSSLRKSTRGFAFCFQRLCNKRGGRGTKCGLRQNPMHRKQFGFVLNTSANQNRPFWTVYICGMAPISTLSSVICSR
jgi:hypothetical protein